MINRIMNYFGGIARNLTLDVSLWYGTLTNSGVTVSQRSMYGVAPWYKGANLTSNTIARLSCDLYLKQPDNNRIKQADKPVVTILKRKYNRFTTAFAGIKALINSAYVTGNGYAYILKDEFAQPVELYNIDSSLVTVWVFHSPGNPIPTIEYRVNIQGQILVLRPDQLVHIKNLSTDGYVGLSMVDCCKESLGIAIAAKKYGAVYFGSGGYIGETIIELPSTIKTKEQADAFRKTFDDKHRNTDSFHNFLCVPAGTKVTKNNIPMDDSQFLKTLENSALEAALYFGLSPHKLGVPFVSGYNGLEQMNIAEANDCYEPMLINVEQEFFDKLLSEKEKESGMYYFEFNRNMLTRADSTTEINNLTTQYNNGLLSFDEVRALRNMPTVRQPGQEFKGVAAPTEPAPTEPAPTELNTADNKPIDKGTTDNGIDNPQL